MRARGAALSFSGGVADCLFSPPADELAYGDMGPLLGQTIRKALQAKGVAPIQGAETIRATVVGAGPTPWRCPAPPSSTARWSSP